MSATPLGDPEQPLHAPIASAAGPSQNRKSLSPSKNRSHQITMGDARTEHLLLAAKKVRAMRRKDQTVGLLTLEELRRSGVVGPDGGVGYVEGYGGLILEPDDAEDELSENSEDDDDQPAIADPRNNRGPGSTPLLPPAKRSSKRTLPPPTTPRSKNRQAPTTTPGGSNFNDLLRAAELATRPGSPSPTSGAIQIPLSTTSATRSTHRPRAESTSDRGSPIKRTRRDPPATDWIPGRRPDVKRARGGSQPRKDDYKGVLEEAGLDLLAQASYLDVARQETAATAPLPSMARFETITGPIRQPKVGESSLAPAIDLRSGPPATAPIGDDQIDPSLMDDTTQANRRASAAEVHTPARRHAAFQDSSSENDVELEEEEEGEEKAVQGTPHAGVMDVAPGAYASPTGATVPGLGKYVHLTSTVPARRMRSPYLKWTVEEVSRPRSLAAPR